MTEELLNGGVVLAGDPAYNAAGELSGAENAHYRHDDEALWRYPGVSNEVFVASGHAINGIQTCRFASAHWLVAQANGHYYVGNAEVDGAPLTSALTVTEGTPIQAITHSNRWFVLNGATANQVLKADGTFRPMGLQSATQPLVFLGNVASAFSATATGYYDYWYTEGYDDGAGVVLESAATINTVATVWVSATGIAPSFQLPLPQNGNATKFSIYRSSKKATIIDLGYPSGQSIIDIAVSATQQSFIDTSQTSRHTAATYPLLSLYGTGFSVIATAATSPAGIKATASLAATAATDTQWRGIGFTQFQWPIAQPSYWPTTNQFTLNYSAKITATGTPNPVTIYAVPMVVTPNGWAANAADAPGFPIQIKVDPTTGIPDYFVVYTTSTVTSLIPLVVVTSTYSSPSPANCAGAVALVVPTSATLVTASANMTIPAFPGIPVLGIPGTRQLDGNFGVAFFARYPSITSNDTVATIADVDLIVNYMDAGPGSGDAYPTIQFVIGNVTYQSDVNDPPPMASLGCVFDGQAVTNDVANPRTIRYAVGDNPEAWPSLYGLDLPTRTNDEISALFPINGTLVAGTKGSLWAIQYLPNEADSNINRGIVSRQMSDKHNVLHKNAFAAYTTIHGQSRVAFVSTNGIFSTDGQTIEDLGQDMAWTGPDGDSLIGHLDTSIYSKVISLVNDTATQNLRLTVLGPNDDTLVWSVNYSRRHSKPTSMWGVYNLTWGGPAHLSRWDSNGTRTPLSTMYTYRRDSGLSVTLHGRASGGTWGGTIVREDGEDTKVYNPLPDATNNTLGFLTRDLYLAGKGRQFEIKDAWVYGYSVGPSGPETPVGELEVTQVFVNGNDITTPSGILSAPYTSKLISLPIGNVNADAVRLRFKASSPNLYGMYAIIFDASDGGDSKRA